MQDIVPRKSIRDIEKPKNPLQSGQARPVPTYNAPASLARPDVPSSVADTAQKYNHQGYTHVEISERRSGRGWQYIFSFILIGLVVAAVYLHMNKKVTVFIAPHTATVTLQNTLIEILAKDIVLIEETKDVQVPLVSTGTKQIESKAQGVVTLFNTSSQPQLLIATTRLQTPKGSVYRLDGRITVPAAKGNIPGSIEAKVTADGLGASYNVTTSDFTLPGLVGSPRFKQVYARTSKGVQGGTSEAVPQFEQSIVDKAVADAVIIAKKELDARILARVPTTMRTLTDVAWVVNKNIAGSAVQVSVTGKIHTISQASLATLIANEKQLLALSQGAVFADLKKGTIDSFETNAKGSRVRMSGEVRLQAQILSEDIQKILTDKSFNQFSSSMKTVVGSKESRFTSKPFWIQSFPDTSRILVVVE